jgi:uncharacterized protein YjbI with pentapeptide repeats
LVVEIQKQDGEPEPSRCLTAHTRSSQGQISEESISIPRLSQWANLAGADLSGANLENVRLYFANLSGANLSGADLHSADLGHGVDLSGADLSGADLSEADLHLANLEGADLSGADLSEANLSEVRSGGISGTPLVLPANWSLTGGYLIGPQADLSQADLSGADLSGADLSEANLTATNLSRANLTGASFTRAIRGTTDLSNLVEITTMKTQITEQSTSIESNQNEISELKTTMEAFSVQLAQLNTQIGDLQGAVALRDARIESLQRALATPTDPDDVRFTEDQIRAMSADYTIGLNDAGNVQMKFNLFASEDLNTFAPLTLNPDSVSVVDGSICLEFAPEDRAAFFRFSVE